MRFIALLALAFAGTAAARMVDANPPPPRPLPPSPGPPPNRPLPPIPRPPSTDATTGRRHRRSLENVGLLARELNEQLEELYAREAEAEEEELFYQRRALADEDLDWLYY